MSASPVPSRARAGTPWKAVLLSGLVFPGLGQLASGRPWRAFAFAVPSAALLVAVLRRVQREAQRLLPTDDVALLDPALPFRLAAEIERVNAAFFLATTIAIVALWLGSVIDAWRSGPRS